MNAGSRQGGAAEIMKKTRVQVPRVVVQTNPASRTRLVVLMVAAAMALAWLGFEIGRSRVAPDGSGDAGQLQAQAAALAQQRDALQARVESLQRDLGQARDALEVARRKVRSLEHQSAASSPPAVENAASTAPPAERAVAGPLDNSLHLQDVQIRSTDADNRFRFSFSVVNRGDAADQVVGTIWIAVNGTLNGTPTRLPLDRVSSSPRPFVKMDFRERQAVEGELDLPAAFTPKNISIEAKPYSRKFIEATEKVDWVTSG